jgi:hypothetical protein
VGFQRRGDVVGHWGWSLLEGCLREGTCG